MFAARNEYITGVGAVLVMGTGTLTKLLNKRDYTVDEATVLSHFFTNLDRNVYAATDNMPSTLWAFLVGQYSRSALSMRDRFLQTFDDMEKKHSKGDIPEDAYVPLPKMAAQIRASGSVNMAFFLEKSADFLKKWGVAFGHASLKDADVVRAAVEGVSQRFTKVIENPDPELGAYEEKSTRYVPFTKDDVIVPPRLRASRFGDRVVANNLALMEAYAAVAGPIDEFLKSRIFDRAQFKREDAFVKTVNAKSFDIRRYWLPLGLATSLGCSFPTRVAEIHLSQMLGHPHEEARLIAQSLKEEWVKLTPGLLTHVGERPYFRDTPPAMYQLARELLGAAEKPYYIGDKNAPRVNLVSHTPDLENVLLASVLYEYADGRDFNSLLGQARQFTDEQKDRVFGEYLSRRDKHDLMMWGLKVGRFIFDCVIDNGAFRDVQRQRATIQLNQRFTADEGYAYPEFVEDEPELRAVKEGFDGLMRQTSELYREVASEFPDDAEYLPAMAHYHRFLYDFHPRQGQYMVELRTTPAGHHSYRTFYQEMWRVMNDVVPRFAKHVKVDFTESTEGRKSQEERAAERREQIAAEERAKAGGASQ